ncbi:MAG: tetratricopeptide repeat protein [Campylobacterales bacterium]|nr:tetratricopeptide repeat protein [Campylobacterales bacterium]
MNRSYLVLLVTALPTLLISSEPSAFGAGDLNSPNPYGLTSSEKVILETKKTLNKVSVKSNNQANELDSLRERLDGLQSIIESLSRKAHNNKVNLQKVQDENNLASQTSDEYDKRIGELVQANTLAISELKSTATELSKVIDKINTEYVSKNEFNALVNDVNEFKTLIAKELKGNVKSEEKNSNVSSADIYNRAKANFDKKYYTDAIADYEYLITKNYKPAYAHYMIGEMNYKRKNYADAISYFKKSSSLYSKASYMPQLMLHTAIAMEKTGDKTHADAFYEAVISKYPDSKEAQKAREKLQ